MILQGAGSGFIDRSAYSAAFIGCLLLATFASGQPTILDQASAEAKPASLSVIDEVGQEHAISAVEFAKLPRQKVSGRVHDQDAEFEGPLLSEVLKLAGVKLGDALRGRGAATVAVLEATDGYRAVVTLLDVDAATTEDVTILADRRDGEPLVGDEAPYRLIVPGDKRPIRWIRMVKSIRVLNLHDAAAATSAVDATAAPEK